eukprot:5156148-Amphidinium_carterae.1
MDALTAKMQNIGSQSYLLRTPLEASKEAHCETCNISDCITHNLIIGVHAFHRSDKWHNLSCQDVLRGLCL